MTEPSRDSGAVPLAAGQRTLALGLAPGDLPEKGPPRPRPVPNVPASAHVEDWIRTFVRHVAEVVAGCRAASQLARWTSEEVYADLVDRSARTARAGGHEPGRGRLRPLPKVRTVHACRVGDDTIEAAVTLKYGDGTRALAACFRRRDDTWICTALEFGTD